MIWNSLSLIHFYGEGFLCVFPNPGVRGSRGPYRRLPSPLAVT